MEVDIGGGGRKLILSLISASTIKGHALFSEGVNVEPQEARDGDGCVDGIGWCFLPA